MSTSIRQKICCQHCYFNFIGEGKEKKRRKKMWFSLVPFLPFFNDRRKKIITSLNLTYIYIITCEYIDMRNMKL